jgi:hypothetical protein
MVDIYSQDLVEEGKGRGGGGGGACAWWRRGDEEAPCGIVCLIVIWNLFFT